MANEKKVKGFMRIIIEGYVPYPEDLDGPGDGLHAEPLLIEIKESDDPFSLPAKTVVTVKAIMADLAQKIRTHVHRRPSALVGIEGVNNNIVLPEDKVFGAGDGPALELVMINDKTGQEVVIQRESLVENNEIKKPETKH